MGIIANKNFN